ncbi:ankyrin repeat domain-containing protein [Leptospira kanakyensis]|nr:ankyrin repeat domain-containing protein [Leptospira kanakyensis]
MEYDSKSKNKGKKRPISIFLILLLVFILISECRKSSSSKANFIDAVKEGDYDRVEDLIEVEQNVNQVDHKTEDTPLILAIKKRDTKMVKILLDAAADVNKKGAIVAPIHSVSYGCQYDIMKLLIKAKVDLENTERWNNATPLEITASNGHIECVKLLVENGARIDRLPFKNFISHLASRGYKEIIEYLIEKGVYLDQKELNQALIYAARDGYIDIVKLLINKNADINAVDNYGNSVLYSASTKGGEEVVKLLISLGAEVNTKNMHGKTALDRATQDNNEIIITMLKNAGAN